MKTYKNLKIKHEDKIGDFKVNFKNSDQFFKILNSKLVIASDNVTLMNTDKYQ